MSSNIEFNLKTPVAELQVRTPNELFDWTDRSQDNYILKNLELNLTNVGYDENPDYVSLIIKVDDVSINISVNVYDLANMLEKAKKVVELNNDIEMESGSFGGGLGFGEGLR